MSYATAEALSLPYAEGSQAQTIQHRRPALEVVEGEGLDARVRQGVSTDFLAKARVAVVTVLAIVVLGACRVGLCAVTLTTLQTTSALRTEIKDAQALETDLKVTRSLLSDTSRIDRIATQNYGMVKAGDYETIALPMLASATDADQAVTSDAVATDEAPEPLVTTMRAPAEEPAEDDAADPSLQNPFAQI